MQLNEMKKKIFSDLLSILKRWNTWIMHLTMDDCIVRECLHLLVYANEGVHTTLAI